MKKLKAFFKEHRKTFIFGGLVLAGSVLFALFLIWPLSRRVLRLQQEISKVKTWMAQLLPGGTSKPLEEVILEKRSELTRLEEGLPQQERISDILKHLSQQASELGVTVVSVRPQPSRPYPNAETPLVVEGRVCHALPIQMQIECTYRTLGKYLESLTDNFPSVVTVDDLDIEREEGKLPNLKVTLLVTSYIFQTN